MAVRSYQVYCQSSPIYINVSPYFQAYQALIVESYNLAAVVIGAPVFVTGIEIVDNADHSIRLFCVVKSRTIYR